MLKSRVKFTTARIALYRFIDPEIAPYTIREYTLDKIGELQAKYVSIWEEKIREQIENCNVTRNFGLFFRLVVENDEVRKRFENLTDLNEILNVIVNYYEHQEIRTQSEPPLQEDYLFIREYYEAVRKYIRSRCQYQQLIEAPIDEKSLDIMINQTFMNGLCKNTEENTRRLTDQDLQIYLKELEEIERTKLIRIAQAYHGQDLALNPKYK